jgi:HEAT repeat protein
MKSSDASVRLHAAEASLRIDPTDTPALRELLAGMDLGSADLRYFSANALGEAALENEQAVFALHRALTDADTYVSITAALNLSKRFDLPRGEAMRAPEMEELARLIDDLEDSSAVVRQAAAIRLGQFGPRVWRAVNSLRKRLADPDLAVRVHAANALRQIGGTGRKISARETVHALVDLLGISKSNIRYAAMYVLGEIGREAAGALPALYDMFSASSLRDRVLLAAVISRIEPQNREMVGILLSGLNEQAGDVRHLSAMALGSAPFAHQQRVERGLKATADDRNL